MDLTTFLKDYGAPVAWILAAIGWFVSNSHANAREKRKEFRSEIDAIERVTKELLIKLSCYFQLAARDDTAKKAELEIKVLFREIDLKWARLSKRKKGGEFGLCYDACANSLEALFDNATGKYFETTEWVPSEHVQTHVQEIHVRALSFIETLHSLFLKKFDKL